MVNKVILVGNLGRDPETRYTQEGNAITLFSLATSHKYKDKEFTEWHNIKVFGNLAEIAGKYLRKGSKVYVEGRIMTDKWQDRNGEDKQRTVILMTVMEMLDSRVEPQPEAKPAQQDIDDDFDDDIPF